MECCQIALEVHYRVIRVFWCMHCDVHYRGAIGSLRPSNADVCLLQARASCLLDQGMRCSMSVSIGRAVESGAEAGAEGA